MIYFIIEEGYGEFVKIGYASDVNYRIKQLQTGNPRRLRVVLTLNGGYDYETKLHKRFDSYRGLGEWFFNHGRVARFIIAKSIWTRSNLLDQAQLGNSGWYRLRRVVKRLFRPRYFKTHSLGDTLKWLILGP